MKSLVVALGGNALLRRGEPLDADAQARNIAVAADAIAELAAEYQLVITHGNGPQIGLLALAAAESERPSFPLDVLGAESEGMIGYLIEQALANRLPGREVCTLLTQVVVAADDPAFAAPSKPIGLVYDRPDAEALAAARGWSVASEDGGWRRVVPSPRPRRIIELGAIRALARAGVIVVCAGGGGIPVVAGPDGALHGVEAVIDKDRSSAMLASALGAAALLMLTDVEGVWTDWRTPRARRLRAAAPAHLKAYRFAPGSMAPKVGAAIDFVEAGGALAGIGRLGQAAAILRGAAGTRITADTPKPIWAD